MALNKVTDSVLNSDKLGILSGNVGDVTTLKTSSKTATGAINEQYNKLSGFVSVLNYGADPTGVNDSTTAFNNAIAYVRNAIITSNFQTSLQVLIPGGIYKITSTLLISPFVHLKTEGFVILQSYITSGSVIHFTAQSGDPTFLSTMGKQQYHRSPLINGADGGILIYSKVDKNANSTIGLEIGSTTDLGSSLPTARYSICDVAIEQFNIGVQMHKYNNYIGTFNNLHIESNNTVMKFGTSVSSVTNSGENFSFHGGVFAQATTGFDWLVDGMDCNFYGCSFDFVTTLFNFQRGYKRVSVFGGHIEGCSVVANSTSADSVLPQLSLTTPIVFCNNTNIFTGAIRLDCDNVRWETSTALAGTSTMYMCDVNVLARETRHINQGYERSLSPKLNSINNSKFQSSDLSAGDAAPPFNEYTISKNGYTDVVTATIPAGSSFTRALKLTGTVSSGAYYEIKTPAYTVYPGDVILLSAVIYDGGASLRQVQFKIDFIDILGNVISTSSPFGNATGLTAGVWNPVFGATTTIPAGAHTAKGYCTISGHITGEICYVGELFLGIS